MAQEGEVVIVGDDGTEHVFPPGFDPKRAAGIVRVQSAHPVSGTGGAVLSAIGSGLPAAANAVEDFATSPTAAQAGGALARGLTTAGEIGRGIFTGSPADILAAPRVGWAAGKGGYWLTKGAQSIARPIAGTLQMVAPYGPAVSAVGGAANVGQLAQMAEPNRRDIGFLGAGPSVNVPGAEPPVLNSLAAKLRDAIMRRISPTP